ncbi:hypothetical protein ACQEVS_28340 [Streptomyces sp. CA-181903]|uniref:hypothetical protein n=1 Tax=Streptomyces sp. CA-181903 TaxID=3240055 RepID=UPI003D8BC66D
MNAHTLFLAVGDRTGRPDPTFALTTLAVETGRLEEAERRAADALAGLAPDADWMGLAPSVRREIVDRVRTVPHYAVDHTEHDRDPERSASPLADCLRSLATGETFAGITAQPYTVYLTGGLVVGDPASAPSSPAPGPSTPTPKPVSPASPASPPSSPRPPRPRSTPRSWTRRTCTTPSTGTPSADWRKRDAPPPTRPVPLALPSPPSRPHNAPTPHRTHAGPGRAAVGPVRAPRPTVVPAGAARGGARRVRRRRPVDDTFDHGRGRCGGSGPGGARRGPAAGGR